MSDHDHRVGQRGELPSRLLAVRQHLSNPLAPCTVRPEHCKECRASLHQFQGVIARIRGDAIGKFNLSRNCSTNSLALARFSRRDALIPSLPPSCVRGANALLTHSKPLGNGRELLRAARSLANWKATFADRSRSRISPSKSLNASACFVSFHGMESVSFSV